MFMKNFKVWPLAGVLVGSVAFCSDWGELSNVLLPTLSSKGIREIQRANFIKNLEVSFFANGLANISEWGTNGYSNSSAGIIAKVVSQEEVHLQILTAILNLNEVQPVPPCSYSFPVSTTKEFFQVAELIGSISIGATIGLSERVAFTDPVIVKLISSILSVESRQNAYFRFIQGKSPNPSSFDTMIDDIWAYHLAHSFIVPGSCPIEVAVPTLPRLDVVKATSAPYLNITNNTALHEFTWDPKQTPFIAEEGKELLVGWVNQVNIPLYTPLTTTTTGKGTARPPQGMNGAVLAVITNQQYTTINDLVLGTMAGPIVLL